MEGAHPGPFTGRWSVGAYRPGTDRHLVNLNDRGLFVTAPLAGAPSIGPIGVTSPLSPPTPRD